ncbi:MAG: LapA family protein [Syntrophales bacterium]|nr:LapA family protein [Syntrophales bacterium]MCK9528180.1 LapA family protein [Syntrophales bacterium]MDX9921150.1 LapA family protein [Syntrophales bacterium]
MWKIVKVIVFLILIIVVTTFAVQNQEAVDLTWYFDLTGIRIPLYLLLYGCIIGGMIVGMAVGGSQRLSLWRTNRNLAKKLRKLEAEQAAVSAGTRSLQASPSVDKTD